MLDPGTNPRPVTDSVKLGPFASIVLGETPRSCGGGLLPTVKASGPDEPPPGGGVLTVIIAIWAAPTSDVLVAAWSSLLLMKEVGRGEPFQLTMEPGTKF